MTEENKDEVVSEDEVETTPTPPEETIDEDAEEKDEEEDEEADK